METLKRVLVDIIYPGEMDGTPLLNLRDMIDHILAHVPQEYRSEVQMESPERDGAVHIVYWRPENETEYRQRMAQERNQILVETRKVKAQLADLKKKGAELDKMMGDWA